MKQFQNRNNNRSNYKAKYNKWHIPSYLSPYDRTVWLFNSFTFRSVARRANDSNDSMIARFKRVVNESGVLKDYKRTEFYLPPAQKRKEKANKARKRNKKYQRMMEQYNNFDFDSKYEAYMSDGFLDYVKTVEIATEE